MYKIFLFGPGHYDYTCYTDFSRALESFYWFVERGFRPSLFRLGYELRFAKANQCHVENAPHAPGF